jgi:hypothetical protein
VIQGFSFARKQLSRIVGRFKSFRVLPRRESPRN